MSGKLDIDLEYTLAEDRNLDVVYHLLTCLSVNVGDSLMLVDPFFSAVEQLTAPMSDKEKSSEKFIWKLFIVSLCESTQNLKIRILTKEPLNYQAGDAYPVIFHIPEFPSCSIEIARYAQSVNNYPRSLHDRWILKENGEERKGVHMGPSLADIYDKDVTMTEFDDCMLDEVISRFETVWHLACVRRCR
ncbi:MAG TPA: hypothetical protein VLX91_05770 [Candidatus Acidoferrales bacterium]|nr:hypothetical protein [Candidatus Acidoferrales bacterium]